LFSLSFLKTASVHGVGRVTAERRRRCAPHRSDDDAHIHSIARAFNDELQSTVTIMQQPFDTEKTSVDRFVVIRAPAPDITWQIPWMPKAWAMTDAFSLLTLALKLAQYSK
jgi:hypothetical protein